MDLAAYLRAIEHTADLIPALRDLLHGASLTALHDAGAVAAGAPDLIVSGVGGVVVMPPGGDLMALSEGARVKALRAAFSNLILTDGLDFIWLRDGQVMGRALAGSRVGDRIDAARAPALAQLLADFGSAGPVPLRTLGELSSALGYLAWLLRQAIIRCQPDSPGLESAAALLPDLTPAAFADQYAQAVVFVLLAARLRHTGAARQQVFTRHDVTWDLPPTSPFLREFFREYDPAHVDARLAWVVDLVAARLSSVDVDRLRREFRQRSRQADLMRGFYATFLASYDGSDPAEASEAAVDYVVRSVDYLLQKRFRLALGLADEKAVLLDPAAGTGTFLYFALQQVYDTLRQQHQLGIWDSYVRDALLPRLRGFEASLAACAVAHLKLSIKLNESGYRFDSNQRLRLYLDTPAGVATAPPLLVVEHAAAEQARLAAGVTVVVGQTPLPGNMMAPAADAVPPDDAARLLAFGEGLLDRSGQGIIALIVRDAELHAVDHADRRQHLMQTFSDIYLLALDTSLALFLIRRPNWQPGNIARVRHATLPPGDASVWLRANDLASTTWTELAPQAPDYLFAPHDKDLADEYQLGWSLDDIFPATAAPLPGIAAFQPDGIAAPDPLPVLAQPFDERWLSRPQPDRAMYRKGNLALLLWREGVAWDVFAARTPTINPAFTTFPLYRYTAPGDVSASPFPPRADGRQPNLSQRFILAFSGRLNMTFIPDNPGDLRSTFGPQDVFHYIYALLHSAGYRQRYADQLQADVPRIPLTSNRKLFRALVRRGRRLTERHLLHHARGWTLRTGFMGPGNEQVAVGHPLFIELAGESGGRVYINETQYFESVPRSAWQAEIAGALVLRDWLRAREGQTLGWQDVRRFQQIVAALRRSLPVLADIDTVIPGWPLP